MSQLSLLNSTTLKTFKYGTMDRSRFMFRKHRLARPKANWLPALDELTRMVKILVAPAAPRMNLTSL